MASLVSQGTGLDPVLVSGPDLEVSLEGREGKWGERWG